MMFGALYSQRLPVDSALLRTARDFLVDDYGGLYLYTNRDFSITKYDSLGVQKGRLMLPLPYRIQSVQNPLNIALFSENDQTLMFTDQNLNQIWRMDFREKFGFVKAAYAENQEEIWVLDSASKNLAKYNGSTDQVSLSYPLTIDYEQVIDMLVYRDTAYFLFKDKMMIYNLSHNTSWDTPLVGGKRLRRENSRILTITPGSVVEVNQGQPPKILITIKNPGIVEKNSSAYFVLEANKNYLYKIETVPGHPAGSN